ncbi:LacI family DNA-binding transcriptional regulator [Paracoccus aerodenitrificans]|uniref:LacI family DNA-binding transcriptional regulator n=1 Tax=Paracoccus aerodenitrificans TaxID=3017781 RepID=UPI0022F1186B|nr:LacI family DNA-binding transcriptional regulator [Paracoccus aerodenitrificans]WBU65454.1 LacI family DNA-binding transcriptional regulator [Paracoccus aerodenitrificans]
MRPDGKREQVSRRVRLKDIAERCGVSTATVSRALSGRGYVAEGLTRRIHDMAVRLNYPLPSSQAGRRVLLAASGPALLDLSRSQFTLHVLEGIQERCETLGMQVQTRHVVSAGDEARLLDEARSPDVAGVLMLTIDDQATLDLARGFDKPVILVNADDPDMRLSSVTPCNRSAAALATQHLRSLGHRRIAFLTCPGRRTITRRWEGWRDTMQDDADPALVIDIPDWSISLAERAVAERLAKQRDFTAILATGDALAIGAYNALAKAGLTVPRDMSVISIDGLPQTKILDPPMTVMAIPMRSVGAVALDLLCSAAANPAIPRQRIELACELLCRGSDAPPQTGAAF